MKKKVMSLILMWAVMVASIFVSAPEAWGSPAVNQVASVSAGDYHTLAIRIDGTLWAWGWNSSGQLGLGHTTELHSPV